MGFGFVWHQQGVENDNLFLSEFYCRLQDIDRQDWHDHLQNFGILRTYRNCKRELNYETYLDLNLSGSIISQFTRLRGGLLHVEANVGRWATPPVPYADSLCRLCNVHQV